ncbi:MAG: glutamine amidotransferase [Polyangiales bacterium]
MRLGDGNWTLATDMPPALWLTSLALAAVAVGAATWVLVRQRSRRTAVLYLLRLLAIALLLLWIGSPVRWVRQVREVPGRLWLLVDRSHSMQIPPGGRARSAQLRTLLRRLTPEAKRLEARLFAFGDTLTALPFTTDPKALTGTAEHSRLGAALEALRRHPDAARIGAVLVLSDGAVTPRRWTDRQRRLPWPVHTVALRGAPLRRDDAITAVHAPAVSFVYEPLSLRVHVRTRPAKATAAVHVREAGRTLAKRRLRLDAQGRGQARFTLRPEVRGRHIYEIDLEQDARDPLPGNNHAAHIVELRRAHVRILLVAGRPSWDTRFFRSFLKDDRAVDLITFFILRTPDDASMATPDELSLIPFPTDELFRQHLSSFDVVVFQNFEHGRYEMAPYLDRIRRYVEEDGGSFLMLGGDLSFAQGGYRQTPIARLLPMRLPALERSQQAGFQGGRFVPVHAPDAHLHPLATLGEAAPPPLPPLHGANRVLGLRPEARALWLHPSAQTPDGAPMPVLAAQEVGRGRSVALATDSLWRWRFQAPGSEATALYKRFWGEVLRWLLRDPALAAARIEVSQDDVATGSTLAVQGLLRDSAYRPVTPQRVRLLWQRRGGEAVRAPAARSNARGRWRAHLQAPREPGVYQLRARGRGPDGPVMASTRVWVRAGSPELRHPEAVPARLRALSAATGGRHFAAPAELKQLAGLAAQRGRLQQVRAERPFADPRWLLLLIAVLGCQWWLQRRGPRPPSA